MATYKPLQSIVLSTTPASVTFSGIDQSYTDLRLVISGRSASNDTIDIFAMRFNGDTGSNYSRTFTYNATSARESNQSQIGFEYIPAATAPTGLFGTVTIDINNYTSTTANKTVISHLGEPTSTIRLQAAMWRNSTVGINAITLYPTIGTAWAAGSTFDLYGIKSGAPQALGGDVVVTDGNYWYHAFRTTQTFTPQRPLMVDYLVVAGGGAGGSGGANFGGGGGAGGLVNATSQSLSTTGYTVTVGAGGALATQADGNNGNNSSFNATTAVGGGGGAGTDLSSGTARAGKAGGSGGGATYWNGGTASGGAATSGQGNKGGDITSSVNNNRAGAGGGGAGVAGANVVTNGFGTAGGNGVNTYSSWASATGTGVSGYYAGGGAGGGDGQAGAGQIAGGLGGGGAAQWVTNGVAGVANTGSGGAGSIDSSKVSGAGGSGIVIVRYPV
jgi:hypothetical protein